jgi:hypothetical protein
MDVAHIIAFKHGNELHVVDVAIVSRKPRKKGVLKATA